MYTYLIGWSKEDRWYYGVQYSSISSPDNLWKSYFTSSKIVAELRNNLGEPDIIQVRKTFNTPEAAIKWEAKVLKRMNVLHNDKWLNANVAGASIQTEEVRRLKGEKIRNTKALNPKPAWNKGLTKKDAPNLGVKGRVFSEEHKAALRKPKSSSINMGKHTRTQETRDKIRAARLGTKRKAA